MLQQLSVLDASSFPDFADAFPYSPHPHTVPVQPHPTRHRMIFASRRVRISPIPPTTKLAVRSCTVQTPTHYSPFDARGSVPLYRCSSEPFQCRSFPHSPPSHTPFRTEHSRSLHLPTPTLRLPTLAHAPHRHRHYSACRVRPRQAPMPLCDTHTRMFHPKASSPLTMYHHQP